MSEENEGTENVPAGSKEAVLADLAAERRRRQELEAELAAEREAQASNPFRSKYVESEAKYALAGLGVKNPERFIKFLDTSTIELDDEGNLTGLDAQVEQIKQDFPELFDARARAGNIDADDKRVTKPDPTVSDQLAAQLLGRR